MLPPSLSHEVVVSSDSQSPSQRRQQQHQQEQQQQQIRVYSAGEQTATTLLMAANSLDDRSNMIVLQANDTTIYQCSLCMNSFADPESLNYHLKTHGIADTSHHQTNIVKLEESVILLACNSCGRTFKDEMTLDEHHRQEHGADKPLYACSICDYTSLSMDEIHNHQLEHRVGEFKYVNTGPTVQVNEHVQYICEICQATFKYRQGLSLHQKLHQPDFVQSQKKHCCEICKKRFCRKQVLLVHMKTHGGPAVPETNNEFVCQVCGKSVSSKTYLTVHMRKHTGEKPHVCDICKKGFISQSYLSVHRRTHTGERPHKCMHCDKSFTQRTTLVVHTRSHTGDKPYRCTDCGKSFASKTMLNSHLKTHAKAHARAQQEQITLQQQNMLIVEDGVSTISMENPQQEEEIMAEPDSSGIALVST